MISKAVLIQCVLLAQIPDATNPNAPETDRYTQPIEAPAGDVDVVPIDRQPFEAPSAEDGAAPLDRNAGGEANDGAAIPSRRPPFAGDPNAGRAPLGGAPPADEVDQVQPFNERQNEPYREAAPMHNGANPNPQHGALTAKQWVRELLTPPADGGLAGRPVSLTGALGGVQDEARQKEIITAYWRLSKALANYHVAAQVLQATDRDFGRGAMQPDATSARLRLDVAKSKLAAVAAQSDLAALLNWTDEQFPLPESLPHVGAYRTRYDEIFPDGANRPAKRLDLLLPAQADVLDAHVAVLNALASSSGGDVAESFRDACGEFLDEVYQYNRGIADYVLLATNSTGDGAELVPMLIHVESKERVIPSRESRVVPTQATESARGDGVERSVLVQPDGQTRLVPVDQNGWRRTQ